MSTYKTYIQQLYFDGSTYTKGEVVDIASDYGIAADDFPLLCCGEPKEAVYRDWPDEHGRDVYIPKNPPVKSFDIDVTFLCRGSDDTIRSRVTSFIDFLCGRNSSATGPLLAIYNEHVKMGRKDVHVTKIGNDMYYDEPFDDEKCASFKVTFSIEDPITEVVPIMLNGIVTGFRF